MLINGNSPLVNCLSETRSIAPHGSYRQSNEDSEYPSDNQGSISPLIITLFSILMILIFIISNIASAYVARRDLTNRVESALADGAQELDLLAYYYNAPLTDYLAEESIRRGALRVPIDCAAARVTFERNILIERKFLASNQNESEQQKNRSAFGNIASTLVSIDNFKCNGSELSASVSQVHELPFQVRVLNVKSFKIEVSASASSFLVED